MALTNAQCKAGKTNGGGAVSSWEIFDGEGYCHVVNKKIGDINFRLYGRAHSYNSSANTTSITMYLFARKDSSTIDSYNNDKYSKIEFTCGGKVVDFTASSKGIRVEGSTGSVRCLGYKEVTGVSCATGSKSFKAIWHGIDGTDYASGTYTISETMYWNKNNANDVTPSISISNKTKTSWTAKISNLRPDRNCYTTWKWNRKNNTSGAAWTDGAFYTVGHDSDTTSHSQDYTGGLAGNNYTIKFTCFLRNCNPLLDTSTRKFELWSVTKDLTTLYNVATEPTKTNRTYNGSAQNGYTSAGSGCTLGGTKSATNAGSYTFTATPNDGYAWAESGGTAAKSYSWTMNRAKTATEPTKTNRTYTGSAQNGYSAKGSYTTLGGTYSATNVNRSSGSDAVGSYTFTATPDSNHAWSDGTTGAKSYSWKMNPAECNMSVSSTSVSVEYNKSNDSTTISTPHVTSPAYSYTTDNTNIATTSISNGKVTINGKSAGSTFVNITHAATQNYNAKTIKINITVTRAPITLPTGATRTYNGSKQSFTNSSTTYMTKSGTYEATDVNRTSGTDTVGSYTATVTPDANHKWADTGGTGARNVTWKINPASGFATWTAANQSLKETQTYTAKVSNVHTGGVLTRKSISNSDVVSLSISGANATVTANKLGSSTITLYVAASKNYTASADKSFTITVRPAEVKVGSTTAPVYIGGTPVRRIYVGDKIVMF